MGLMIVIFINRAIIKLYEQYEIKRILLEFKA